MAERDELAERPVGLLVRDFDLDTLAAIRHEVQSCGESHGVSGVALYGFVVAVNEIITNAVQHGGGGGRLEVWRAGGRLYCRVTDRGPGLSLGDLDGDRTPPPLALGGRGLWLARQLSADLTVRSGAGGTTVTLAGPVTSM